MPIRLPSELAFKPPNANRALEPRAVEEFLALARRVSGPRSHKHTLETFKKHFRRCTGDAYYPSSDEGWAETDLLQSASDASENGPEFVAAFLNACEELERGGAIVPTEANVNSILHTYGVSYHVSNGALVSSVPNVAPPESPMGPAAAVSKALSDAVALVGQSGASSAIDRAHTALHGYLIYLCEEIGVGAPPDASTTKLFRLLRDQHPALKARGPRAGDIEKILQSLAVVIDALSPIRNRASLAHPTDLLEEPEAMAALNATRTLFRYVQDSIQRHGNHGTTC